MVSCVTSIFYIANVILLSRIYIKYGKIRHENTTQKNTTRKITLTLTLTLTIVIQVSFYQWSKDFSPLKNTTCIRHIYTTRWYSTQISGRCSHQARLVCFQFLKIGKEKVKRRQFHTRQKIQHAHNTQFIQHGKYKLRLEAWLPSGPAGIGLQVKAGRWEKWFKEWRNNDGT